MVFVKYLIKNRKNSGGRNSTGRITVRHRGGSFAKCFVLVNFRRRIFNTVGKVIAIEKDPVRTSFVSLVFYRKYGTYEYLLCPHNLRVGSFVMSFKQRIIKQQGVWLNFSKYVSNLGNSLLLQNFKIGSKVFNVEKFPGQGGSFLRSAGTFAKIIQKIELGITRTYIALRMKTGKLFYIHGFCMATLGQCSNPKHKDKSLKKAGTNRNLGWRPSVRGVAMNPIDHPHGGGEGKTSGGRSSVSPWGKLTKGNRTTPKFKRLRRKRYIKRIRFGSRLAKLKLKKNVK